MLSGLHERLKKANLLDNLASWATVYNIHSGEERGRGGLLAAARLCASALLLESQKDTFPCSDPECLMTLCYHSPSTIMKGRTDSGVIKGGVCVL